MSTMNFLWIYSFLFSSFFLQHQRNPNRKGEMMVSIKNQPCCHLSHTILHCYYYQTSSFSLCLQQASVTPKHMFPTVVIQNLHVAWIGLVTSIFCWFHTLHPNLSQESKLNRLQIQTSDSDHQNHWSLHQWWVPGQFSGYWSQSQSFHSLFWTVKLSRKLKLCHLLILLKFMLFSLLTI